MCLLVLPVGRSVADAAECGPAGGSNPSFVASSGDADLVVVGGGFGHGVGMSQYGAQGAALLGCRPAEILATYYPGTQLGSVDPAETVRVGLQQQVSDTRYTAHGSAVPWQACDGTDCQDVATQPAGNTWLAAVRSDGRIALRDADGQPVWVTSHADVVLRAAHDGSVIGLDDLGLRLRWGFTQLESGSSGSDGPGLYVVQHITGDGTHPGMQRYLWGVAEMPAAWEPAALRVQAIAARSIAQRKVAAFPSGRAVCRCHVFGSTRDQRYLGWGGHEEHRIVQDRWVPAVDDTAGHVVLHDGAVAETLYSSSHGGWSDSSQVVFGGGRSYLTAVDDSRWNRATDDPRFRWQRTFDDAALADTFGMADFDTLTVEQAGEGRRPTTEPSDGAVATGWDADGNRIHVRLDSERLRWTLRIPSGRVRIIDNRDGQTPETSGPQPSNRTPDAVDSNVHTIRGNPVAVALTASDPDGDELSYEVVTRPQHGTLTGTAPQLTYRPDARFEGTDELRFRVRDPDGGSDTATITIQVRPPDVRRLAGTDRFATAATVSRSRFDPGIGVAYVATGSAFPDALAASAAAGANQAPVLLTARDRLPDATASELDRLRPGRIVVLGGTAAVSADVQDALRRYTDGPVDRIAGSDRYHTAAAISRATYDPDASAVYVATGTDFPDALTGTPPAVERGAPVLLVTPDAIPDPVAQELRRLTPDQIVVLGGTAAVSSQVVDQFDGYTDGRVDRIAGSDRFATAVAVASQVVPATDDDTLYVATGTDFPDALTGGVVAGLDAAPVLLVPSDGQVPSAVLEEVTRRSPHHIVVLGGPAAVSDDVLTQLRGA